MLMVLQRKEYLDKLIAFKDKQLIKVVTGIRRCGKSTLLEIYQNWLLEQGTEEEQIISINFEDIDFEELTDYRKLYAYLKERLVPGKMTYIFLDEIQHVEDFPKVVDSLYIKKNVDIYITGSNAYMLSSEIATLISGRYVQIEMLPLSFKEYMESTGSMTDRGVKYTEYLENSSFPYTLELKGQPDEIRDYLEGLYNTIVVKDIVSRKRITDTMMLKSVLRFVFDNIGNPLSSKKIADTMTSDGRKIDTKTVEKYLEALTESYIIYQAKRYNIKGKQYLKTLEKYYVVDIGLRYMLLGSRQMDAGHILENVVYLELLRRGYDVYVGKIDSFEVDFVAQNSKGIRYYQVALSVRDEKTLERELRPLMVIRDHYPKMILTLDDDPEVQYDGIRRINARDWLLGLTEGLASRIDRQLFVNIVQILIFTSEIRFSRPGKKAAGRYVLTTHISRRILFNLERTIYSVSPRFTYPGFSGGAMILFPRISLACLSTIMFSIRTPLPMTTSAEITQFLTTAPGLMTHPLPMMEFSISPSIRQPLETTEEVTLLSAKYCVGQESFVRVYTGHSSSNRFIAFFRSIRSMFAS